MKSSLIPEKPILVYPSLAATVGLDEAIMLSALSDISSHLTGQQNNGYQWYTLDVSELEHTLPFWDRRDLQRVSTNLREKGIIIVGSAPITQDSRYKFAFNEKAQGHVQNRSAPRQAPPIPQPHMGTAQNGGKNFISASWQPDQMTLDQLAQLSIPSEFALQQTPEFVTYWRERGETHRSWGQKFIQHTIGRWRNFEAQQHRQSKAQPMASSWMPTQDCVNELSKRIPSQFVHDQIQEFISYWQATGEKHISWDNKFIKQVQARWADMESKRNVSTKEFALTNTWRPSLDAMDIMIQKSAIPQSFVEDAIPEFIIYWQDKGTKSSTWNSMFIKHVRLQWHRYQYALDNSVDPQPILDNWQPSADVYDILKLANIDKSFAEALVKEFVLYWKDRNEIHRSWNTKFLQHVKRNWAMRHDMQASDSQSNSPRSTRELSLEEQLTDRSWAN